MSYRLLERLADEALPATLSDPNEVNMLRSYVAAGLVTAEIPPAQWHEGQRVEARARVLSVTLEGRKTLRRHKHRAMWAEGQ